MNRRSFLSRLGAALAAPFVGSCVKVPTVATPKPASAPLPPLYEVTPGFIGSELRLEGGGWKSITISSNVRLINPTWTDQNGIKHPIHINYVSDYPSSFDFLKYEPDLYSD